MKFDLGIGRTLAVTVACILAAPAWAQTWPDRTVRIVVPFAPGGGVDTVTRVLADQFNLNIANRFVVDNRAGAGGSVGAELVAAAPPDGYTLLTSAFEMAVNPTLRPKASFHVLRDFTLISDLAHVNYILACHPSVPVETAKDLIALAKARPGVLNYGSSGMGGGNHLTLEYFSALAGIKWTHVPFKGASASKEAVRIRDSGLQAYKIHPPAVWQDDIEICGHVRKVVGDGYRLMLDSTWSYNFVEAVRVGRALEDFGYYWFEDPLDADDITNYVKLRQKLHIPIMATEYSPGGFQAYAPWITLQATDFLRGDVAVKGGITALVKTAHLAEAFHMNLEVHHGGNSLNNVANLHVILAIPNTEYFEILLPDATQKYGLVEDITVGRDGLVRPPDGPGLGAKIDFELIERKKTDVLR